MALQKEITNGGRTGNYLRIDRFDYIRSEPNRAYCDVGVYINSAHAAVEGAVPLFKMGFAYQVAYDKESDVPALAQAYAGLMLHEDFQGAEHV